MRFLRNFTAAAFALTLLVVAPACSSESGDRATTDAPAGSNEPGTTTTESSDATITTDSSGAMNGASGTGASSTDAGTH